MRAEPIRDPHGDLIASQEKADRVAERADSPLTRMHPLERYDRLPEADRAVLRKRADGR